MKHRNSECNVSRRRFLRASKKVAVGTLVGSSLSGVLWLDDAVAAIPVSRGYRFVGHALYIADFDAETRTITNAKAIANAEANPALPFLYPRWTRDESAVMYHANRNRDSSLANDDTGIWSSGNQLYMYCLKDGSTHRVSTDPNANYMYPHGEKTPK